MNTLRALTFGLCLSAFAFSASANPAAFTASDRPAAQKARDEARRVEADFILSHVKTGDSVLDMGAGQSYLSWLLSSAVGRQGVVYAQNPQAWIEAYKMGPALEEIAAKRENVRVVSAPFVDIPTPEKPYDVVVSSMVYHDTYNEADQNAMAMNSALFNQIRSGGLYIIVDHQAPAGSDIAATNTTHRIDKARVVADLKAAGFVLAEDKAILSHPEDKRDLNVFDPAVRGKTDRFVLVFRKP